MMHAKIIYSKLENYNDCARKALETLATSFYSSNKQPRERAREGNVPFLWPFEAKEGESMAPLRVRSETLTSISCYLGLIFIN